MTALLLAGCGGGGNAGRGGIAPPPSEPPRGFPPPRDVPIDPQLVASAKAELDKLLAAELAFDRVYAIEGLRYVEGEKASEPIIAQLSVKAQAVRFAAAMAAGDLKLEAAKPKLLDMVNDPDPRVQVAVRYALHKIGDTTHTQDLEKFATHGDPKVRGSTAMVLGRLNEPTAKGILRLLRADARPEVRQQADEALFLLDDTRGRDAILGYTTSSHPDDVIFAMRALAQKKDPGLKLYAWSKLSEANDASKGYLEVGLAAAMAVGAMGADDGYGVAMKGMADKDPQLGARRRMLAAATFGTIGRPDAQPFLATLLKDSDSEVRAAAATAILQIAKAPKKFNREGKVVN
ncbi:HEAT repeat domain-containing protein [Humisphaera borealis]|uniref:HEAT repeat domain-containing protein n=1 Tax=Humisphaera borealis TaxID=2807512 RepID=A0A7M2WRE6_9BACT|nr:HEAT repeat domain-containing protein [Humisphaera borealis]QOV87722.1 HEAT repeat domain-containing protein [Humisphaera borealis]